MLYDPVPVLDHGFIRVIDYMGDDAAIVQAARVSYGRGTKQVSGDRGLINYLMRHRHTSPFEMCELKLHVKLPIFVARQWIRHRTANVNEYSAALFGARSRVLHPRQGSLKLVKAARKEEPVQERLFALPDAEQHGRPVRHQQAGPRRGPGRGAAAGVLREIGGISSRSFTAYEKLLGDDERPGIARELARMVLPLNTYTQWYWKVDLHNLLHFLRLRHDSHAQYEIRAYAEVLLDMVRKWVPLTAAPSRSIASAVRSSRPARSRSSAAGWRGGVTREKLGPRRRRVARARYCCRRSRVDGGRPCLHLAGAQLEQNDEDDRDQQDRKVEQARKAEQQCATAITTIKPNATQPTRPSPSFAFITSLLPGDRRKVNGLWSSDNLCHGRTCHWRNVAWRSRRVAATTATEKGRSRPELAAASIDSPQSGC